MEKKNILKYCEIKLRVDNMASWIQEATLNMLKAIKSGEYKISIVDLIRKHKKCHFLEICNYIQKEIIAYKILKDFSSLIKLKEKEIGQKIIFNDLDILNIVAYKYESLEEQIENFVMNQYIKEVFIDKVDISDIREYDIHNYIMYYFLQRKVNNFIKSFNMGELDNKLKEAKTNGEKELIKLRYKIELRDIIYNKIKKELPDLFGEVDIKETIESALNGTIDGDEDEWE